MIYKKIKFLIVLTVFILPIYRVSADSGGYIVKFNTDISKICDISNFTEIADDKNIYSFNNLNDLKGLESYVEYYETNDKVDLIEGEETIALFRIPSDELYSEQWQTQMVNADYAWELETYGNQINVAVIDSGCNAHIDVKNNLVGGYDYTNKSDDYSDNVGHGTHVTGIIAAQMNDYGIIGVAPKVNVYALKCVDKNISAGTDILAEAIYDAVDKYNCKVINMSLGIKKDKATIREAVEYAYENGVIIIAAAGNDGNDSIYYPAGYDEVIGVGSVGIDKSKSYFSQENETVFVVAPGEKVTSLNGESGYKEMKGTSQATPLVTGAAALLLSTNDDISPQKFKELIKTTSEDLGDIGKDNLYGWGLLNIKGLMQEVIGECYVSPINDGEIIVYNNSNENLTATAIWGNYLDKKYVSGEIKEIFLMPQKKIKLKQNDYIGKTQFFLWQSLDNMKPLTKKRVGGI